jgi:hypothetical protein
MADGSPAKPLILVSQRSHSQLSYEGRLAMILPLSRVEPLRIRSKVLLEHPGLFRTFRAVDGPLLAFNWGEEPRLMTLEGEYAFHHFELQLGHSMPGILTTDIEFRVDITSRYDAVTKADPLGSLILSEGKLFVVAMKSGNQFGEPHEVPLWGEYPEGTPETKVGFTRWEIIARDGDDHVTLWSTPEGTPDAE